MTPIFLKNLFAKCKMHGSSESQVILSNSELYALICLAIQDLGWSFPELGLEPINFPDSDYYQIDLDWFSLVNIVDLDPAKIMSTLDSCIQKNVDFSLYIENLSALHRRRVKYKRILSRQPLPTMDQIGPRVLLEYGCCDAKLLANWMVWRKWIYDIDNRAAQETGYLFEPVLASCLGGQAVGAGNSPIKRLDATGNPTANGRQIDCLVPATKAVYEFKLRVTIAASGQGRFNEELSFPVESQAAGYRPVLIVLDPTPSHRLTELSQTYVNSGGEVYQGDAAWQYMEEQAGSIISVFIAKYIRPAIQDIESVSITYPQSLTLSWLHDRVVISNGENTYLTARTEMNGTEEQA
jgi:hypothetical protein